MMGDRTCPRSVLCYISIHTMGKVQKIYEFKCRTSSSEPYRIVQSSELADYNTRRAADIAQGPLRTENLSNTPKYHATGIL